MKPSIDEQIEAVEYVLSLNQQTFDEHKVALEAAIATLNCVKQQQAEWDSLKEASLEQMMRGKSFGEVNEANVPTGTTIEPKLVTQTNYRDVVAVALAFAGREATNDSIVVGVMRALKGMSNPSNLKAEIERQRSL